MHFLVSAGNKYVARRENLACFAHVADVFPGGITTGGSADHPG